MEELEESLKKINQELEQETNKMTEVVKKVEELKKQKDVIQTLLNFFAILPFF